MLDPQLMRVRVEIAIRYLLKPAGIHRTEAADQLIPAHMIQGTFTPCKAKLGSHGQRNQSYTDGNEQHVYLPKTAQRT